MFSVKKLMCLGALVLGTLMISSVDAAALKQKVFKSAAQSESGQLAPLALDLAKRAEALVKSFGIDPKEVI